MPYAVYGAYVEQAGKKLMRYPQKVLIPCRPYRYEQSDAPIYADLTVTSTCFFKLKLDSNSGQVVVAVIVYIKSGIRG